MLHHRHVPPADMPGLRNITLSTPTVSRASEARMQ
jgi:hypothetical protein